MLCRIGLNKELKNKKVFHRNFKCELFLSCSIVTMARLDLCLPPSTSALSSFSRSFSLDIIIPHLYSSLANELYS